jgi:cyclase
MSLSRREFLGSTLLALAAGHLPTLPVFRSRANFVELRRNVGIFLGRGGPIGWLISEDGSLLVDSQFPDTAAECLEGLRERGAPPIEALVNTHHHGDHTGGNGVFRDAVRRIVAHERAVDLHRRTSAESASASPQVFADTPFATEWSTTIGDERVTVTHRGSAHTGGDATVHFERANVVHMGDLVFNRAYPFVDVAGGARIEGWIDVLEQVAREHSGDALFIYGHAAPGHEVTGRRPDILLQRDFLSAALDAARRGVAAGSSRDEVTSTARLSGFEAYVALAPRLSLEAVIGAAFDEVSV